MSENNSSSSCGCGGCVSLIVFILVVWALWFGLTTSWGTFVIDIFPPYIGIK